jgi:hypothetical protein
VGLEHFNYLLGVLNKFHGAQYNMAGNKFAGIDIEWDYATHRCRISMPGYISVGNKTCEFPLPVMDMPVRV